MSGNIKQKEETLYTVEVNINVYEWDNKEGEGKHVNCMEFKGKVVANTPLDACYKFNEDTLFYPIDKVYIEEGIINRYTSVLVDDDNMQDENGNYIAYLQYTVYKMERV